MVTFWISWVWHSQIQHWAFCPNDFLPWDIVQSWSSLWSLMRTERHPTSTKTCTSTAGNDGKGFFFVLFFFLPKVRCPCVKTNKVELRNVNSFSSHKVGFHVLRGDSWGELTVQLCVIAVNGFPVLIMELQKDEKTQAPPPTCSKMTKHWKEFALDIKMLKRQPYFFSGTFY